MAHDSRISWSEVSVQAQSGFALLRYRGRLLGDSTYPRHPMGLVPLLSILLQWGSCIGGSSSSGNSLTMSTLLRTYHATSYHGTQARQVGLRTKAWRSLLALGVENLLVFDPRVFVRIPQNGFGMRCTPQVLLSYHFSLTTWPVTRTIFYMRFNHALPSLWTLNHFHVYFYGKALTWQMSFV